MEVYFINVCMHGYGDWNSGGVAVFIIFISMIQGYYLSYEGRGETQYRWMQRL